MGRSGYLWGTREGKYSELGRSSGLEEQLRRLGATNPELALEETKQLFSGCALPKDGTNTKELMNVRYGPVHLYKKQEVFKNMESFSAFCTNGPEKTNEERESFYTHLTLFDLEDLKTAPEKGQSWLDRIFGTPRMSPAAEKKIRQGAKNVELAPEPSKVDPELREEDRDLAILLVTALYNDTNSRIVIRMGEKENFLKEGLSFLARVYSLLPLKMAMETGFSLGEQPAQIIEQTEKANTRIFLLEALTVPDPERDFPEKTLYLDLKEKTELPENLDTELAGMIRRWSELDWDKRRTAMEIYLAEEGEYFRREYYIEESKKFFGHPFWAWKEKADLRFDPRDAKGFEAQYQEVKALYRIYSQFDICRRLPWVREEFLKLIPDFLMEGDSIESLRQAVVRKAVEAGENNPNTVENCRGYRKWLTGLMGEKEEKDDSFDCARLAAEDAKQHGIIARNEELERQLSERDGQLKKKDTRILEIENELGEKEKLLLKREEQLQEKDRSYGQLQAEIADKESQWGAFIDGLEQQLGKQTVDRLETEAARKINPLAAEEVDALQMNLTELEEQLEDAREELRRAGEQLEHEKRSVSRYRSQTDEVIKKLKLALVGMLIVGVLAGILIGMLLL